MPHRDFSAWMRDIFPYKVQKISVDGGFTCPNRDGRVGWGGCTFCDNRTFTPAYCGGGQSVAAQIEAGKQFFARKYPDMRYLAYFQSFSNTYGPTAHVMRLYREALSVPGVVGIVIGTRPDCVDDALLDRLADLSRSHFVLVEYGVESANDDTLRRVNRGHDFACSRRAIERTHARGIFTGAHVILGLPGEGREESLRQAEVVSRLPIDVLKLHQMQVVRGTRLAEEYARNPFPLYTLDEYIDLVIEYVGRLRGDIVLDRFVSQCPPELLVAPRWGVKNHEFTQMLMRRARQLGASL